MKMKCVFVVCLALISSLSFGGPGYMVKDVVVVGMSSTSSKQDAFWLWYEPKDSVCNGAVKFQLSKSGTEGSFERAFTLAATAYVSGKPINIYNYEDVNDCYAAVSIEIR